MAKLIPAAERIQRARALIQKAREVPVPEDGLGKSDLSYVAQVKDLLRQARDLVKFISMTAGVSSERRAEVAQVLNEIERAGPEILK